MILILFSHASIAQKNNPFSIAVEINKQVITNYEIDQRILMLNVFGMKNILRKQIIDSLIEETLLEEYADQSNIQISSSEFDNNLKKFAQRGGLNELELMKYLSGKNISKDTLKNYMRAGILKQKIIQKKFLADILITQKDIDSALLKNKSLKEITEYKIKYYEILMNKKNAFDILSRINNDIDSCLDLLVEIKKYDNLDLKVYEIYQNQISKDLYHQLNKLDINETIINKTDTDQDYLIMLCSREASLDQDKLERIKNEIFNKKMIKRGNVFIQDLKNNAYLSIK